MEWTGEVAAGDWIRERLDDGPGWGTTMHGVVPHAFPAYVRILHPASRSRPVGEPWPPGDYETHRREWEAFGARMPEIETHPARWADAAAAFGTTLHPLAQWGALVRRDTAGGPGGRQQVTAPDGWQFDAPLEGDLDADVLARVARHLVTATTTPDAGYVAVWDGWGGLVGGLGIASSSAVLSLPHDPAHPADPRHDAFLGRAARDPFNNVFLKPTWQPGVLSDEISRGPRLELRSRDHVLFRGGVRELVDDDWPVRMPWRDTALESQGFAPTAQSPSLIWPDDRSWALVTEIDFDSTIVGGSADLVAALVADPALEAFVIPEGADLTGDSDEVNG